MIRTKPGSIPKLDLDYEIVGIVLRENFKMFVGNYLYKNFLVIYF